MQLIVEFGYEEVDIIDVPLNLLEDINSYQEQFWKWLFDKNTEHKYWYYNNGEKDGCCYRSDAFVEWLNLFPLSNQNEKASILSEYTTNYDRNLPSIYF